MTIPVSSCLKISGEFERSGQLDKALYALILARKVVSNRAMNHIHEMNLQRILNKARQSAKTLMAKVRPLAVFEHKLNPNNYAESSLDEDGHILPIISLTTISNRLDRVKQTLNSITEQTLKPHSINLYISEEPYLIDEGIQADSDALKQIASLGVNIYNVKNIGPYRKLIPLIIQLRTNSATPRTPIITVDDDVIYPPDIIERLMLILEKEEAIIAHRGRELAFVGKEIAAYRTLPSPKPSTSYLNMGTGKNGIAYRLGYFPLNPEDFIGPILAPTADDIWCKWVTSIFCIPTIILEPRAAYDVSLDFLESDPSDKNGLFYKYNAKGTNDEAMANLEKYYSSRGIGVVSLFDDFCHG